MYMVALYVYDNSSDFVFTHYDVIWDYGYLTYTLAL